MKMKKGLSILLTLTLVLGMIPGMSLTAYADPTQTDKNNKMKYFGGKKDYSYEGFAIQGFNGTKWLSTTYGNEGFETAMLVDGYGTPVYFFESYVDDKVFVFGKDYTQGDVTASITASLPTVQDEAKVFITYTVKNNSETEKRVRIGSYGDVRIGDNDYAPIKALADGSILMKDNDNEFRLIPGGNIPFTTTWYGGFGDVKSNVFTDLTPKEDLSNTDSGVAWSWTITIPAKQTVTRMAIFSAGAATTVTINYNSNGGTGIMPSTGAEANTAVTLKKNEFTKEGYAFAGWDLDSAGTTVVYADEATLNMPGTDTTLYAVWKDIPVITTAPTAAPTVAPTVAPTAAPVEPSKPIPKTGDSNNLALWLTLMAIGLVLIVGSVILRSLTKNPDGKK